MRYCRQFSTADVHSALLAIRHLNPALFKVLPARELDPADLSREANEAMLLQTINCMSQLTITDSFSELLHLAFCLRYEVRRQFGLAVNEENPSVPRQLKKTGHDEIVMSAGWYADVFQEGGLSLLISRACQTNILITDAIQFEVAVQPGCYRLDEAINELIEMQLIGICDTAEGQRLWQNANRREPYMVFRTDSRDTATKSFTNPL